MVLMIMLFTLYFLMMVQNTDGNSGKIVKKQNMMEYLLYAKNTTFKSIIKHMVLYDDAYDPIFSNDGSKYGWRFKKDEKYYIRINDKTYGPYDYAFPPKISNDGSKYGWEFEKDDKKYIQINDKTYGPYDKATFTFTKDNKAYIAYISGNELVIEEVE